MSGFRCVAFLSVFLLAALPAAAQPQQTNATTRLELLLLLERNGEPADGAHASARPARSVVVKPGAAKGEPAEASARNVSPRSSGEAPSVAAPIALGLVGGAVGFAAGGVAGYAVENADGCDGFLCGVSGAVIGGIAGEMAGMALGVHLGNRRRGNYWLTSLGTVGVGAAGLLLTIWTEQPGVLIGVPVAQLAAAVPIARSGP